MRDNLWHEAHTRDPYADFDEAMRGWSRRGRLLVAVLIAVAIATLWAVSAEAFAVIADPCRGLTASDWEYWMLGCWLY